MLDPRSLTSPADRRTDDDALVELADALREAGYRFTTVSPATHQRVNERPGSAWARDLGDVFGWSRPFRRETIPAKLFALMERAGIAEEQDGAWHSRLRVSTLADEIFFHSAFPTSSRDAVFFGPDTYRFANALQAWLRSAHSPVRRIADVGCGSGAGGILAGRLVPDAHVTMVDINDAALRLAAVNIRISDLGNVVVRHSDLLGSVTGDFDFIIANPPYLLDPLRRAYRHGGGTLGEGLSRAIVADALGRLSPGGTLLLYTGVAIVDGHDVLRADVERMLEGVGATWSYQEVDPDVFGEELDREPYDHIDRIAVVVLTVTRQDS